MLASPAGSSFSFEHPLIGLQPLESPDDAVANGQFWFPAGGLNLLGIQKNKRVVTDPTPVTSAVIEPQLQTQMRANPTDGVVDLAIFRRAQIVNGCAVQGGFSGLQPHDVQHGVEAVVHVEVRLPLAPVAQYLEVIRMGEQLFKKVEHVPMRIALAENRNESENVTLKTITLAVGANQRLARQLRGSIERSLDRKWRLFRSRNYLRFPIDRTGRSKRNLLNPVGAHGFEDIESGERILLHILAGMLQSKTNIRIGREVENQITTRHRFC